MDDGKLRALLTAVECGSFSKAAAQLGYTQSAMTHLVNKLEAEVGCTLLERDSQGIRLTDAGKHLLPYIQNVVCACDTLLQEAAEQNDPRTRTLRIGCFASIARARLPELLRAFRELHPEIKMDVLVRGDELPAALASGEIQLALVAEARAQPRHRLAAGKARSQAPAQIIRHEAGRCNGIRMGTKPPPGTCKCRAVSVYWAQREAMPCATPHFATSSAGSSISCCTA